MKMTHTYTVSGMTCEGCVAKVRHRLLMHPDVSGAEVNLGDPKVIITMQRHLSVDELQNAIGRETKYIISEDHSDHSHHSHHSHHAHGQDHTDSHDSESRSWVATYKPILLIFAFISAVSLITAMHSGQVHGMMFMNTFMGGFFLVFSFFKMLNLNSFADSYAMYDVIAKRFRYWGFAYAFIELGLGLAYITNFNPVLTNSVTLIVMAVSLVGVLQTVLSKRQIQCACLGAVFNLPMSTVTVVEDSLMIGMSAVTLAMFNL